MRGTPWTALRSLRGPWGRGPRARRGQSPLAAGASRPRDAGPSGKHSCLITEQECTTGSLARLRHGHKRGCVQLAPPNCASRTSRWMFGFQSATLSEKVTACHPPRTPSAQNPKDTPQSSLLNGVTGGALWSFMWNIPEGCQYLGFVLCQESTFGSLKITSASF